MNQFFRSRLFVRLRLIFDDFFWSDYIAEGHQHEPESYETTNSVAGIFFNINFYKHVKDRINTLNHKTIFLEIKNLDMSGFSDPLFM